MAVTIRAPSSTARASHGRGSSLTIGGRKMKLGNRYIFTLCVIALVIAIPGGLARVFGAPIGILASIAAIQLFAMLAFSITLLPSLALSVRAAFDKEWRAAASYLGAATIPVAAWCLAAFANEPGWQAVMGI